jgi:GNAT superfamily N-acetyltransferase
MDRNLSRLEYEMKLIDIDERTKDTFFRCMHDEKPEDPFVGRMRRQWYSDYKNKGLRAKVLLREDDAVVGLCQYIPIEHSHLLGKDLMAIFCMWIHGYEHLIGNQQGKGYGRFMLDCIEEDSRASGAKGIAAWGMDFPFWNPVSFYEHMGYERVETNPPVVLCWKKFSESAAPPALLRPKKIPKPGKEKVSIALFYNGWCPGGFGQLVAARKATEGLGDLVEYDEIDTSDKEVRFSWGIDNAIYLEGKPFRPYAPPWKSEELREEILQIAENKRNL